MRWIPLQSVTSPAPTARASVALAAVALVVVVLGGVTGCNAPAETRAPTTPFEHPSPTPYEPENPPAAAATLTPPQVGALLPELMGMATEFDPDALLAIYNDLFADADANCPEVTTQGNSSVWYGACTTAGGTVFKGSLRLEYVVDEMEEGGIVNGFVISTEGSPLSITATDGRTLQGSFFLSSRVSDYGDSVVYSMVYNGEVKADVTTAAGNRWLMGSARGSLIRYAAQETDGRYYAFGGSFAATAGPLADAGVTAVDFSDFALIDYGCVGAMGAIDLRDQQGGWHVADFAPLEDATSLQLCDSCGELSFLQEQLGDFCGDKSVFENLIKWESTPW